MVSSPVVTAAQWGAYLEASGDLCCCATGDGGMIGLVLCGSDGMNCYLHQLAVDLAWNREVVHRSAFCALVRTQHKTKNRGGPGDARKGPRERACTGPRAGLRRAALPRPGRHRAAPWARAEPRGARGRPPYTPLSTAGGCAVRVLVRMQDMDPDMPRSGVAERRSFAAAHPCFSQNVFG